MRTSAGLVLIVASAGGGCGADFANLTASLGGATAGQRGQIGVVVINDTPHQVVATMGTFDQTDADFVPDFVQFVRDEIDGTTLSPDASSEFVTLDCGRVFAVGSNRLLELIRANAVGADDDALVPGAAFVQASEDGAGATVGSAAAFEVLLGVDFPCGSIVVVQLEGNGGGEPFRIEFELIPSQSPR